MEVLVPGVWQYECQGVVWGAAGAEEGLQGGKVRQEKSTVRGESEGGGRQGHVGVEGGAEQGGGEGGEVGGRPHVEHVHRIAFHNTQLF